MSEEEKRGVTVGAVAIARLGLDLDEIQNLAKSGELFFRNQNGELPADITLTIRRNIALIMGDTTLMLHVLAQGSGFTVDELREATITAQALRRKECEHASCIEAQRVIDAWGRVTPS